MFKGKSPKCRNCRKEDSLKHYNDNKEYYLARNKHYGNYAYLRTRKKLVDYLTGKVCEGIKPDSAPCLENRIGVLEFDHINSNEKFMAIAEMVRSEFSWPRIEAEIAKCQILCANCHRRRTHKQQDTWASKSACPDHYDESDDAPPLVRRSRNRNYPKLSD